MPSHRCLVEHAVKRIFASVFFSVMFTKNNVFTNFVRTRSDINGIGAQHKIFLTEITAFCHKKLFSENLLS